MYIPASFRVDDPAVIHEIIQAHPFATLVTVHDGAPLVTQVPVLHDAPAARLLGHLARANPQSADIDAGGEALVLFQGPHAYVSPTFYEDPAANVPTWSYVAVEARGPLRPLAPHELRDLLARLSHTFEAGSAAPWTPDRLPPARAEALLGAVIGFELRIAHLDGKLKLSQNRPRPDALRVRDRLLASADPTAHAVGAWMQRVYGGRRRGE